MDIAALSMQNSMTQLQTAASVSTMRKVMDQQEQSANMLIQGMQTANAVTASYAGANKLDVRA